MNPEKSTMPSVLNAVKNAKFRSNPTQPVQSIVENAGVNAEKPEKSLTVGPLKTNKNI